VVAAVSGVRLSIKIFQQLATKVLEEVGRGRWGWKDLWGAVISCFYGGSVDVLTCESEMH